MNVKTYLGKRGYILYKEHFSEYEIANIKKELTVKPYINPDYGPPAESFSVYSENANKLYIPKYIGLEKFGKPDIERFPTPTKITLKFDGCLRENQHIPIKECLKTFKEGPGGGILALNCASGKTVIGLYLIAQLGKKTLVIVHKEFLINQWKERIRQFLPNARIGVIQQDKVDIEDKDIVIGMLQSISMKAYAMDTFDSMGFVIIDECHRIPCQVFSRALRKINSQYMLGLSATPDRKDGLTKVLKWYIGDVIYSNQKQKEDDNLVSVKRLIIESDNEHYNKEINNYRGKPNFPIMINNITENLNRTKVIISFIVDLVKEKRKILLLSDRRNHLDDVSKLIHKDAVCTVGYYIGGMKPLDLKLSEECELILGTFAMASEAMDIPGLDTLILASPKSDIRQAVGRIIRKKHENIQPKIIDVVDNFSLFQRQAYTRNQYYRKKKYTVEDIRITDKGEIINRIHQKEKDTNNENNCNNTTEDNFDFTKKQYMFSS